MNIPESAVRELIDGWEEEAWRSTPDEQSGLRHCIAEAQALLATAAPQPAPEPEGLREAARICDAMIGNCLDVRSDSVDRAAVLQDLRRLREALARPAAAETPLIPVRLSMLERLCRDWRADDEEYSVLIGVSDGEPVAFDAEYSSEGVYNLAPEGPEGATPRPAAAEGVEGKAASIARAALDKMDREPPTNEFITACAALRRIAALASDDGEGQADG